MASAIPAPAPAGSAIATYSHFPLEQAEDPAHDPFLQLLA